MPQEAAGAFLEGLQADLACVAYGKIVPDRHPTARSWQGEYSASLNGGQRVRVRSARGPYWFRQVMSYKIRSNPDGTWEAFTYSYAFGVFVSEKELLTYHLHPWVLAARFPHIHVQSQDPNSPLAGVHLPTGMVTFGDFVGLLIRDLGVAPLRADWREALGL